MPETKSSKKNAKRAAARARKRLLEESEDRGAAAHPDMDAPPISVATRPKPKNRLEELKQQMEEAKERKDHVAVQELREQIWLVKDQLAGRVGEGAELAMEREVAATRSLATSAPSASSGAAAAASVGSTLSEPEKRLRALNRKLRQIETIKERKAAGVKLEDGQITKLASEKEIVEEIKDIEEAMSKI